MCNVNMTIQDQEKLILDWSTIPDMIVSIRTMTRLSRIYVNMNSKIFRGKLTFSHLEV